MGNSHNRRLIKHFSLVIIEITSNLLSVSALKLTALRNIDVKFPEVFLQFRFFYFLNIIKQSLHTISKQNFCEKFQSKYVSFIQFFVFGHFWRRIYKNVKILRMFVYVLQGKMGKTEKNQIENQATKVTEIPNTKRWKYGMNVTVVFINSNLSVVLDAIWFRSQQCNTRNLIVKSIEPLMIERCTCVYFKI